MVQAKFSLRESQAQFLKNFKAHGFKDKSAMVRAAIEHFRKKLSLAGLEQSADLYTELYSADDELKSLTESGLTGWPE